MIIYIILISLVTGSFAGVLVHRIPINEKIVFSRSRCDFCKNIIPIYNNIPVLSFIWQKGRCKHCGKKIDRIYLYLEIVTLLFFMILYKLHGLNIVFFYKSTILTILLISAFIDIKTQIIPDRFYISILLISFIFSFAEKNLENWYLGVAAFCLPLLLIYSLSDIFKKELIGFGDIKLMCSVGGFITYTGITSIIYFYELLYITAGFFCVLLILLKKPKKRVYIAFAPFIFTAVLLWEFRNVL